MTVRILIGDCTQRLSELPDNSVDSVVCDPPYHLHTMSKRWANSPRTESTMPKSGPHRRASSGFMGQRWDGGDVAFQPETWAEVLRVLKPGGHLIAFSGTRTYHRMAVAIEDAGFEVRDMIAWHYGSGFPKSHDISKALDKSAGAEREVVRTEKVRDIRNGQGREHGEGINAAMRDGPVYMERDITAPATDAAREWEGWGTALKPATEPVLCGAKPVTMEQHFAIVLHELTVLFAEAVQWSNSSASDAEKSFTATLVKLHAAASSVLDSAKIRSLASIGIASSAARSFTLQPLASDALTRTRGGSALSHVRPSGSQDRTKARIIRAGEAVNLLTAILDTSTCVTAADMSESIALSWLGISDEILSQSSKFTIETASRLTTALRTLSFSLQASISAATGNSGPDTQPICLARKPLSEKSIAANVLKWGTGALNIDGCRIETADNLNGGAYSGDERQRDNYSSTDVGADAPLTRLNRGIGEYQQPQGRWPANLCHDGSDEVVAGFPDSEDGVAGKRSGKQGVFENGLAAYDEQWGGYGGGGSAARFFYCAKATTEERGEGNNHPTVKPVALMQWLVRLVTPKGGTVLDPFMGSGSTGIAADAEQFSFIGCELSPEYAAIAERRIRDAAGMFAEVKAA